MRFRAKVEHAGKTAAGVRVPDEVVFGLGPSRRPAVRVTVRGYTYRSSVASMGGVFMLGMSNAVRKASGVSAGEVVDIDIELDTEPRVITVPADLAAALVKDAKAKRFFDSLSYSNKRRLVEPIEAAKAAETRERRIAKTVDLLHEGRI